MKILRFSLIPIAFFMLTCHILCQDTINEKNEDKIEAILKVKDGNIHLRWAPTSPGLWLKMQRGSFIVKKQSWQKGQFDVDAPLEVISDTLRVWAQSDFEQLGDFEQANEYLMLAGYCMHAPYESIREKGLTLESIVNREEELTNRFSSALFAADRDKQAAKAMALSHIDKNVDLNKNHAYHILFTTEDNKVYQAYAFYNIDKSYEFTPSISKSSEEEGLIVLSWDKETHSNHYTSYWIERSIDNKQFERLNTSPYVHAFDANLPDQNDDFIYVDSVENYQPYYYRIIGLDAFGDESTPSQSLKLMGRDRTPPSSISIGKAEMHLDKYMNISWVHNDKSLDLHGYYVKKSNLREGPFVSISPLLNTQTNYFQDANPNYIGTNFYQVCAIDTARNEACSYPIYGLIRDTIPPLKPTGLKGFIDSSGIVTLNWDAGQEFDLKGYNVYFANKWNRVFTILNDRPVLTNQYLDTVNLNSLTEDIYYRIVAIDVRDNLSTFSDMVQLFKPDTIAPGPAIFTNYQSTENSIILNWAPSSSKDVVKHYLSRAMGEGQFEVIKHIEKNETSYTDFDLESNTKYKYRIQAIDDSGLKSRIVADLEVTSANNAETLNIKLATESTDEGYKLVCEIHNIEPPNGKLIIYAQEGDGPFITWKTIKLDKSRVLIPIPDSVNIKYKGRIIQHSGHKSMFSDIVGLQ